MPAASLPKRKLQRKPARATRARARAPNTLDQLPRELRQALDQLTSSFAREVAQAVLAAMQPRSDDDDDDISTRGTTLAQVRRRAERRYFATLYAQEGGNVSAVARRAGMSRAQARALLEQYRLHKPRTR